MKTGDKAYLTCGELFNYDTPDFDVGDNYYEGVINEIVPSKLLSRWTVDTILEQMDEALYETVGEAAFSSLDMDSKMKEELQSIISNFVDDNVVSSCYSVIDIVEKVMTEED